MPGPQSSPLRSECLDVGEKVLALSYFKIALVDVNRQPGLRSADLDPEADSPFLTDTCRRDG